MGYNILTKIQNSKYNASKKHRENFQILPKYARETPTQTSQAYRTQTYYHPRAD